MSDKEVALEGTTLADQIRAIEQAAARGNFRPLRVQIRATYDAMCQPEATSNATRLIRSANLCLDFPDELRQVLKAAEREIFAKQLRQLCKSKSPELYALTLERISLFMTEKKPVVELELAVA